MFIRQNKLISLISVIALANFVTGSILEDCSSNPLATVGKVSVSGCDFDKDAFCELKRGTTSSISVGLVPNSEVKEAKIKMGAKVGAMYLPFPMKDKDDACKLYGLNCPMEKDSNQTVVVSLPILAAYPSMPNMKVQFKVLATGDKDIVCISFPAKIVS